MLQKLYLYSKDVNMTQIEFLPYQNRHIKFRLLNSIELQGIVYDKMDFDNNKAKTLYAYIPTNSMIAYKKAEQIRDVDAMKKLCKEIDIIDIEEVIYLNY